MAFGYLQAHWSETITVVFSVANGSSNVISPMLSIWLQERYATLSTALLCVNRLFISLAPQGQTGARRVSDDCAGHVLWYLSGPGHHAVHDYTPSSYVHVNVLL